MRGGFLRSFPLMTLASSARVLKLRSFPVEPQVDGNAQAVAGSFGVPMRHIAVDHEDRARETWLFL
jgi:hypothetical protein